MRAHLLLLLPVLAACSNSTDAVGAGSEDNLTSAEEHMTFVVDGAAPARTFVLRTPTSSDPSASLTRVAMTATLGDEELEATSCDPRFDIPPRDTKVRAGLDCIYGNRTMPSRVMTVSFVATDTPNRFDVTVTRPEMPQYVSEFPERWRIVTSSAPEAKTNQFSVVLKDAPADASQNPLGFVTKLRGEVEAAAKELGDFPIYDSNDGYIKGRVDEVVSVRIVNDEDTTGFGRVYGEHFVFSVKWTAVKADGTTKSSQMPASVMISFDEDKGDPVGQVKAKLAGELGFNLRTVHWSGG